MPSPSMSYGLEGFNGILGYSVGAGAAGGGGAAAGGGGGGGGGAAGGGP